MCLDYLNMVDSGAETKYSNLNTRESRTIRNMKGDKTTEKRGATHQVLQGNINTGPGTEASTECPIYK